MIKVLFIFLTIEWGQVITAVSGTSGVAIILAFIAWARNKKSDVAQVNMTNASTEKVKAEAAEIKAKADVTIVDSAFKLIQRLSDECDMTKKQLEKTQHDLDDALDSLREITSKLNEVQHELNLEREKNTIMTTRFNSLLEELNKLKAK